MQQELLQQLQRLQLEIDELAVDAQLQARLVVLTSGKAPDTARRWLHLQTFFRVPLGIDEGPGAESPNKTVGKARILP